jgi:tRNA(His) guanylyltransferase
MPKPSARAASWEIYSEIKARAPVIVRADGRGFKKILESWSKPYDLEFARSMVGGAVTFFAQSGLSPALAFTFSDEISLLFLEAPFAGRLEKLDSVVSGFLSAALSLSLGQVLAMDCRTIPLCQDEIAEYLAARQDEAWRNHVFSYGFYMLCREGMSSSLAMDRLRGMRESEIHELVFAKGVNLAKTPAWERRGILVYRKEGQIAEDWELPLFAEAGGEEYLKEVLQSSSRGEEN